jgi:hypothetical protein
LTEVFPCFFLSYKANARVKLTNTGHGPHSFTLVAICVFRLLFVLFYVLFVCKCVLPPRDNPIAVNKYIKFVPLTSVLDGRSWSTSRPRRFTPRKDPVRIVQEDVWDPRSVWKDSENLTPTRIRSPDHPARKQSLYRLSYPGPHQY